MWRSEGRECEVGFVERTVSAMRGCRCDEEIAPLCLGEGTFWYDEEAGLLRGL